MFFKKLMVRIFFKSSKKSDISVHKNDIQKLLEEMALWIHSYQGNSHSNRVMYLIVGLEGLNKTKILKSSGLLFEELHLEGLFSVYQNEQCVFIDAQGFLVGVETTDISEFFKSLRKYKRKISIDGIIFVIDVNNFLETSRSRDEILKDFPFQYLCNFSKSYKKDIPVYMIVSAMDQVSGFSDIVKSLTLPEYQSLFWLNGDSFGNLISEIEESVSLLSSMTCRLMHESENIAQKYALIEFVRDYKKLTHEIYLYMGQFRNHQKLSNLCYLSGVYLYGNCFDPKAKDGTFIQKQTHCNQRLINKLMESAGQPIENWVESAFSWKQIPKSVLLSGMLILLLSGFIMYKSLCADQSLFNTWFSDIAKINKDIKTNQSERVILKNSYHLYNHYLNHKAENQSLFKGDRLSEAYLAFQKRSKTYFLNLMTLYFLKPYLNDISNHLEGMVGFWMSLDEETQSKLHETYYQVLEIFVTLHFVDQVDSKKDFILPIIHSDWMDWITWNNPNYEDSLTKEEWLNIIQFYLENYQNIPNMSDRLANSFYHHKPVVDEIKEILALPDDDESLYQRLLNTVPDNYKESSFERETTVFAPGLFSHPEPILKIFTPDAWDNAVQPELRRLSGVQDENGWILDTIKDKNSQDKFNHSLDYFEQNDTYTRLKDRYFLDYHNHWQNVLSGLELRAFPDLRSASLALAQLSADQGVIVELLKWFSENTNVSELDKAFTPIQALVPTNEEIETEAPSSEQLDKRLAVLRDVQIEIDKLAHSANVSRDATDFAVEILSSPASHTALYRSVMESEFWLSQFNLSARQLLYPIFLTPLINTWQSILNYVVDYMSLEWENSVWKHYQNKILSRFPFAQNSTDEVTRDDFIQMFHPNRGVLSKYTHHVLNPFLSYQQGQWHKHRWLNLGVEIDSKFLSQIESGMTLGSKLIEQDRLKPIVFDLYPIPVSGVQEIQIQINDSQWQYRNEPQQWNLFTWDPERDQGISIRLILSETGEILEKRYSGHWALFRLFADANSKIHDQYQWTFYSHSGKPYHLNLKLRDKSNSSIIDSVLNNRFSLSKNLHQFINVSINP